MKVKLEPETIYDFEIDNISADIDNRRFEEAREKAELFPEPQRTIQLKRIAKASHLRV